MTELRRDSSIKPNQMLGDAQPRTCRVLVFQNTADIPGMMINDASHGVQADGFRDSEGGFYELEQLRQQHQFEA